MQQIARNLSDPICGPLNGKRYLIHDRDPLFTTEFREMLGHINVQSVKLPARSPNLNAYAERFVRSIKEDCLNRTILFGEDALHTAVREYVKHYHCERNHQALSNKLISPEPKFGLRGGIIERRERLGGMLNFYYRAA